MPRTIALRYGIYPLDDRDGELRVAVVGPLPAVVEEDLGFALGVNVRQCIATLARIHQAMARDYEIPLEPRLARLIDKLEGRRLSRAPGPSVPAPAPAEAPKSQSGTLMMGDPQIAAPQVNEASVQRPVAVPATAADTGFHLPGRRNTWPGMLAFAQQEARGANTVSSASPTPTGGWDSTPPPAPPVERLPPIEAADAA